MIFICQQFRERYLEMKLNTKKIVWPNFLNDTAVEPVHHSSLETILSFLRILPLNMTKSMENYIRHGIIFVHFNHNPFVVRW